ncbi:MAG: hypothetical protein ACE5I1_29995, partial [bacterium]
MDGESHEISPLEKAAGELELPKILEILSRYTLTPMAATELKHTEILNDPQAIVARLTAVSAYRRLLDDGENLPLEHFSDLEHVLSNLKLPGSVLAPKDLVSLAIIARIARQVRRFCSERQQDFPALWQIAQQIIPAKHFEKSIEQAIDFVSHEILDSASPALRRIRREIESVRQKARKHLQQILKQASAKDMLQEQLITIRDGRLVLMVKGEFRRKINGVVHDQSASGQTLFIEPVQTVEFNNRVRQLQAEERTEIERILATLSNEAREVCDALSINYRTLIELDTLQAKAHFSRNFACTAPQVNANGRVVLYAARHPLLLEKFQDREKVVPLQLEIGHKFKILIITGPNAGGKTVAMKTTGLMVLMAR